MDVGLQPEVHMIMRESVIMLRYLFASTALVVLALPVGAATLSGSLTADNSFTAYISANDTTAGTLISSGNNWSFTYSFSGVALTPGTTYFLHIIATDAGQPFGFAGNFALTGSGFTFANGSTSAFSTTLANAGFWRGGSLPSADAGDWVQPTGTVTSYSGPNGDFPGQSWIWATGFGGSQSVALSTTITADQTAIPEPLSAALLGAGLLGLGMVRCRRAGRMQVARAA